METSRKENNLSTIEKAHSKICDILKISDGDSRKIQSIKSELISFINEKQYKSFQKSIGMKANECDGILGQNTVHQLELFIKLLQSKKSSITEISQSIFKMFGGLKEKDSSQDNESSTNIQQTSIASNSDTETNSNIYRTDTSPQSKLPVIKQALKSNAYEPSQLQLKKAYLRRLLNEHNYTLFQSTIGIDTNHCDGRLGQSSFNQLLHYLGLKQSKLSAAPISHPTFGTTPISKIISYKSIQNEETDNYCCSKTARLNGKMFGLSLPQGNAYDAGTLQPRNSIATIPSDAINKKPAATRQKITLNQFNGIDSQANFMDFFAESKSKYGHRAIAFRDETKQRYVLDPYIPINGKLSNTPIKLNTYLHLGRKIVKAHLYHSNGYTPYTN